MQRAQIVFFDERFGRGARGKTVFAIPRALSNLRPDLTVLSWDKSHVQPGLRLVEVKTIGASVEKQKEYCCLKNLLRGLQIFSEVTPPVIPYLR